MCTRAIVVIYVGCKYFERRVTRVRLYSFWSFLPFCNRTNARRVYPGRLGDVRNPISRVIRRRAAKRTRISFVFFSFSHIYCFCMETLRCAFSMIHSRLLIPLFSHRILHDVWRCTVRTTCARFVYIYIYICMINFALTFFAIEFR